MSDAFRDFLEGKKDPVSTETQKFVKKWLSENIELVDEISGWFEEYVQDGLMKTEKTISTFKHPEFGELSPLSFKIERNGKIIFVSPDTNALSNSNGESQATISSIGNNSPIIYLIYRGVWLYKGSEMHKINDKIFTSDSFKQIVKKFLE